MTDKSSNIVFYIGVSLLFVGGIGLTFLVFFAIVGLPVFILGVFLVGLSKKKSKHKLIIIGTFTFLIIVFWPIWIKVNTVAPETFLIPDTYRGKVNIIYNQNCGIQLPKEDGRTIYNIPEDGILLVSENQEFGLINQEYYLVDSQGKRHKLPKMDVRDFNEEWTLDKNLNEPPRDILGVFHWGRTGSSGLDNDDRYTFQEFYVSTYTDLMEKFGFKYDQEFYSLKTEQLMKCRE